MPSTLAGMWYAHTFGGAVRTDGQCSLPFFSTPDGWMVLQAGLRDLEEHGQYGLGVFTSGNGALEIIFTLEDLESLGKNEVWGYLPGGWALHIRLERSHCAASTT